MDLSGDSIGESDAPPARPAADVLAVFARLDAAISDGRADAAIVDGRAIEIDIDALCDELEAEADAMEAAQRQSNTPSAV